MNINIVRFAAVVSIALCCGEALAGRELARNPPSACSGPGNRCGCPEKKVTAKCIKATVDLGETTPWTGSLECSLKIFADDDSPSIFTADSLYAVLGGYAFKRLGTQNLSDGATPAEVVFSHPNGEPVHFVFAEGESLGRPDPGVHIKMDERLMMVDAEGWATTSNPVYYDLYIGDGSRRRFLATNMTGALGQLVSIVDARGITTTPADMGVDIVYDSNGVRQYLTPSRLANVTHTAGFTGYDVRVYALQEVPAKDAQTGLYAVPAAQPAERLSIRRENDGKRAIVTVQKGAGEEQRYVFDYAMGEWSLTRPSGAKELRERYIVDERDAKIVTSFVSATEDKLEHVEYNYKWESWGFAMTNRVEGFNGVTDTTTWTYYTSGNGKGQVKTEQHQSGLLIQYAYDNLDRIVSETRSGPDMMTEVTIYDYTPVDPSDPVLPVDTRPRTVVRKLNNIECERTYYVYSPLTNVVERVGAQGAPYGGTNALRTVTTYYPADEGNGGSVGGDLRAPRAGFVASIRHEDGKLDLYDYELSSNIWVRTVTHLHEQSPAPVSGKTTRDITATNARGEEIETRTEAYIDGIWYTIARNRMTYNFEGKRITSENLAGQVTTTAWDCCHKVSETEPDGSTTTWDYDDEGRMIASSRLIPLDMTNVTWLTTCYRYDALGRQTATWQTNFAAQVGLPATRTRYDALGRVIARVDQLGNTTTTEYSPDGRTISVSFPNGATHITSYSANGDIVSVVGSAVTPEFTAHGIFSDGICWTKIVEGESELSPRFTKHCDNMLVQIVREERSGFNGAVLATTHSYDSFSRLISSSVDYEPTTEYTYDTLGNRIAKTSRTGGSPVQWRRTSTESFFVLSDSIVWLTQTNIISCSDVSIAPLVTSSAQQLTGLTAALPSRSRLIDIRGNVTEKEMLVESSLVTSRQTLPYATNKPLSLSRYGISLMDVSVSAVTNTVAYDALGRQIAQSDGRGNMWHNEFNVHGQRSAFIDALGRRVSLAYDRFGNFAAITNAVGRANVFEFDHRHRKTYEGGATYPARYEYDVFGNKTLMATYRDEVAGGVGDVTTWRYDEGTGLVTNKVYADGKGPAFSFSPDGKLTRRVWARGVTTDYAYDDWGNLTNKVYSDGTPTVSWIYDVMGREIEVRDAAGVTTCLYDDFGELTNETVIGVAGTNTIERYWDEFGRTAGYALNGTRQTTLAYDLATGRLLTMQVPMPDVPNNNSPTPTSNDNLFSWSYLPGSDRKSALTYPNGLTASWQYNADNRLRQVCNALLTNVVSQYDFVYDAAGRRVEVSRSGMIMSEIRTDVYGYNDRSELVSAATKCGLQLSDAAHAYRYDDSGNRIISFDLGTNRAYTANSLNQYMLITNFCDSASLGEDFYPHFDADGNQILVKTGSGVWSVAYNGENRPILWNCIQSCNTTVTNNQAITMFYDRLGRRIVCNDLCFVYDGYLQISRHRMNGDSDGESFVWDPTETSVTRPLAWIRGINVAYYTHDGDDKDISEVVSSDGDIVAHYEYAPFGAVTCRSGADSDGNPWRFSSEYSDDDIALSYYNYRHYNPESGRWLARDPIDYGTYFQEYIMLGNNPLGWVDELGMDIENQEIIEEEKKVCEAARKSARNNSQVKMLMGKIANKGCTVNDKCDCCGKNEDEIYPWKHGKAASRNHGKDVDVTLCTNSSQKNETQYIQVLIHEIVHALDHCRKRRDNFSCDELACSEIAAYSQCGACKMGGWLRVAKDEGEVACVQRNAVNSLMNQPVCSEKNKAEVVKKSINNVDCLWGDARRRIQGERYKHKDQITGSSKR